MAFNIPSCKRLSLAAGVQRCNQQITEIINIAANSFLNQFLKNLELLLAFCNKKTVSVLDIKMIPVLNPLFPKIITCSKPNFTFLNTINDKISYPLYTTRRPFADLVKNYTNKKIHFTKEAILVLQSTVEHFIIHILKISHYFNDKDTLFPENIEITLKKLYPQFNET